MKKIRSFRKIYYEILQDPKFRDQRTGKLLDGRVTMAVVILLMINWQDRVWERHPSKPLIRRGSGVITVQKLVAETGWSRNRVRGLLEQLKGVRWLSVNHIAATTIPIITVCSFAKYNDRQDDHEPHGEPDPEHGFDHDFDPNYRSLTRDLTREGGEAPPSSFEDMNPGGQPEEPKRERGKVEPASHSATPPRSGFEKAGAVLDRFQASAPVTTPARNRREDQIKCPECRDRQLFWSEKNRAYFCKKQESIGCGANFALSEKWEVAGGRWVTGPTGKYNVGGTLQLPASARRKDRTANYDTDNVAKFSALADAKKENPEAFFPPPDLPDPFDRKAMNEWIKKEATDGIA